MAVQYDSKNNQWDGWVSSIINSIRNGKKQISAEASDMFSFFDNDGIEFARVRDITLAKEKFEEFCDTFKITSEEEKEFLKSWNGVGDISEKFQKWMKDNNKSLFSFANITKTAVNAVKYFGAALGSMAINFLISKGIELAATAFDNYIHRVEKAKERTSELSGEFEDLRSRLSEHKKTVSELAKRYDELSKGVNNADNSNISLSDNEYGEFLDISKRLIDAFPELYNGLDENGNAILNIGTNAQSASERLQELIEQEEHLANVKIAGGINELFKNVSIQIKDAEDRIAGFKEDVNNLNETWKGVRSMKGLDISGLDLLEVGGNAELQNAVSRAVKRLNDELRQQLEDGKIDPLDYSSFMNDFANPALYGDSTLFHGFVDLVTLDKEQKDRLQELIQAQIDALEIELYDSIGSANDNISLARQNADAVWVDFIPDLISGMKAKTNFKILDDAGLGDFAVSLVEQLDSGLRKELEGTAYEDNIYAYVRDKILAPLQNAVKDESGNIDTSKLRDVKKQLSDATDLKAEFSNNEVSLAEYADGINALISALEELGMSPDIIKNVKVLFDYGDVSDIQKRMDKSVNQISGYQPGNYYSTGDDRAKMLEDRKKLQEYRNKLTEEEIQLWLEVTAGIKGADKAIREFEKRRRGLGGKEDTPTSKSAMIDIVNGMSDGFDIIDKIYADVKDKGVFDFANLDSKKFKEVFGKFGVEYESFIEKISKSPNDIDACQQAFNKLVGRYIEAGGVLDSLNDKNAEVTVSMLELMGVANAQELVDDALLRKKIELITATDKYKNAADSEKQAMLDEIGTGEKVERIIAQVALQKQLANANALDTSGDINAICSLAQAAGFGAESLYNLAEARAFLMEAEAGGDIDQINEAKEAVRRIVALEQQKLANYAAEYNGADASNKSSGSKSEKDAWLEEYKRKLKELENMLAKGRRICPLPQ